MARSDRGGHFVLDKQGPLPVGAARVRGGAGAAFIQHRGEARRVSARRRIVVDAANRSAPLGVYLVAGPEFVNELTRRSTKPSVERFEPRWPCPSPSFHSHSPSRLTSARSVTGTPSVPAKVPRERPVARVGHHCDQPSDPGRHHVGVTAGDDRWRHLRPGDHDRGFQPDRNHYLHPARAQRPACTGPPVFTSTVSREWDRAAHIQIVHADRAGEV